LSSEDRAEYVEPDYLLHGLSIRAARNAALKDLLSVCLKQIALKVRRCERPLHDRADAGHESRLDMIP